LRPIIGNIMNEVVKAIGELEGGDEGQSSQWSKSKREEQKKCDKKWFSNGFQNVMEI
jgi:hypothetical protein